MLEDFKKFALRGNVVDMAVGIIIGAAFGKIVSSFVKDVIMPPIGMATGGVDFADLAKKIGETADGEPILIAYGQFFNSVIDFIIVAFAIFMAVKVMNNLKKKEEEAPAAPPEPSAEEKLLTEIRDLLKK